MRLDIDPYREAVAENAEATSRFNASLRARVHEALGGSPAMPPPDAIKGPVIPIDEDLHNWAILKGGGDMDHLLAMVAHIARRFPTESAQHGDGSGLTTSAGTPDE